MKLKRFAVTLLMLFCVLSVIHAQEFDKKVRKEVTINGKKISKRVRYQSITEYDSNGKEIYYKTSYNYERWQEYDSNGNMIHQKDSLNNEEWHEYDSYGNIIYLKSYDAVEPDSEEYWYEYEYYPNGKIKTMKGYTIY